MQFFGTYNHRIDAKGRLALPSKFRKLFDVEEAQGFTRTSDLLAMVSPDDDCVHVYTQEDFDDYVTSVFDAAGGYNPRKKDHVELRMALHASVVDVSIDSAGRINLPQNFRDRAGLKQEVTIVGNEGHFEIWDSARVETKLNNIDLASLLYE